MDLAIAVCTILWRGRQPGWIPHRCRRALPGWLNRSRARGAWTGTHVILKTGRGTLDVRLGPSDFLAKKRLTLSKDDQIEVAGSIESTMKG
ncbi:MAG: hypothetical protein ABSH05_06870 [Bryobacteraceae bacterium]|jgi:hypothetical protein